MTTESPKTYQCTSPMIQLTGAGGLDETTFRNGDVLPSWAKPEEVARLLADGFIEEIAS